LCSLRSFEHQLHKQGWLVVPVVEDLPDFLQLHVVLELILEFALQAVELNQGRLMASPMSVLLPRGRSYSLLKA
jgi:hypothetical protein